MLTVVPRVANPVTRAPGDAPWRGAQEALPGLDEILSDQEIGLYKKLAAAYAAMRLARGDKQASIDNSLQYVTSFVRFAGKAFWNANKRDFEQWAAHLGRERNLRQSTQRVAQAAIRTFQRFLITEPDLRANIIQLSGHPQPEIVTPENSIPHRNRHESPVARKSLSYRQIRDMFDALNEEILVAARFRGKDYWTLCRDKTIVALLYLLGLRREEPGLLDIGSYIENPNFEHAGEFGTWSITGKGRGGKKHRHVHCFNPVIKPLMTWYLNEIRPWFLGDARGETALFLNQNSQRIGSNTAYRAATRALGLIGVRVPGKATHIFRNTFTAHMVPLVGMKRAQEMMGHEFITTTELYYQPAAEDVAENMERAIIRAYGLKKST